MDFSKEQLQELLTKTLKDGFVRQQWSETERNAYTAYIVDRLFEPKVCEPCSKGDHHRCTGPCECYIPGQVGPFKESKP